jgi:GH24 family phage-related lysozyme (muramidase)
MKVAKQSFIIAVLASTLAAPWQNAAEQTVPAASPQQSLQLQSMPATSASIAPNGDPSPLVPSPQLLFDFKDSDIKFNLRTLMDTLRDSQHEGWVLAAYPDPKTSRPLIGAGFGLDVVATEHPQRDPLNPHPFVEPSSAQLWQAAGLNPEQLQRILDKFDRDLEAWSKKRYRKKIRTHTLQPDLTEEEATRLLRISTIQAVENARAYCRDFDQLTAPQQMALSQLVFQMGVNLEEFAQFLGAINSGNNPTELSQPVSTFESEDARWKTVQRTLIESEWARRSSRRAATVIAMFDPDYLQDPRGAERRVDAILRPPVKHHRKKAHSQSKRKLA